MTASRTRTVPEALTVRATAESDLSAVVDLHLAHLPHGLFPRLGRGFMRRWHRTYLTSGHGISLVVVDRSGRVVGFLAGSTAQRAHVRTVLEHDRLPLALAGATALAARPAVAVHFVRTRARQYLRRLLARRAQVVPVAAATAADADVAVLAALVVDPAARGARVGARLVARFTELAAAGPARRAELITLDGSAGARAFYEGLGWTLAGARVNRDGQACLRMERALPTAAGPDTRPQDGPQGS